eukprot:CAMPEP_0184483166 /NCGR_PEP_ID=MMETSP0113_2-20130426/4787_1 /TAXON_ID=91329 /ORGANISM="Norrisiella sphaerica, Strain BC52" /LENGTH=770 /DNA_ID=CAMNT_0026863389 /DNA_START=55 /DNA_END=2367 /DNA_ORIENTATION=+
MVSEAIIIINALTLLLLASQTSAYDEISARASFEMNGVTGYIKFDPLVTSEEKYVVALYGLESGAPHHYFIHEFPADLGCSEVGDVFDPSGTAIMEECLNGNLEKCSIGHLSAIHGKLTAPTSVFDVHDNTLTVKGKESIRGRSVVIYDSPLNATKNTGPIRACATIMDHHQKELTATFSEGPVTGSLRLRQHKKHSQGDTSIELNLRYPTKGASLMIKIFESIVIPGVEMQHKCSSVNIGQLYNPDSKEELYAVGNIWGRHGDVVVGDNGRARSFFTDENVPLKGPFSVGSRTAVILERKNSSHGEVVVCGFLGRRAQAVFDSPRHPISGNVNIVQETPYDPPRLQFEGITIGTNHTAMWFVHGLPLEILGSTGTPYVGVEEECFSDTIGAVFMGMQGLMKNNTGNSMSLFGERSVVGRSIVLKVWDPSLARAIHYCTTIRFVGQANLDSALFTTGHVTGAVYFQQEAGNSLADTSVLVDINVDRIHSSIAPNLTDVYVDLRIHNGRVSHSMDGCNAAGGVFNPNHLTLSCSEVDYSKSGRCPIGDLSGVFGSFRLPAIDGQRIMFSARHIPLSGPLNITSRSLVIESSAGFYYACADVLPANSVHPPNPAPSNNFPTSAPHITRSPTSTYSPTTAPTGSPTQKMSQAQLTFFQEFIIWLGVLLLCTLVVIIVVFLCKKRDEWITIPGPSPDMRFAPVALHEAEDLPPLPDGWERRFTPRGIMFYFNSSTGRRQYSHPTMDPIGTMEPVVFSGDESKAGSRDATMSKHS